MTSCGDLSILFRASAGPRRGYGHLVRCRSLARALGVRPLVALRGGPRVVETAVSLGCDVIRGSASNLLRCLSPDVLVVDDPVAADARRWMRAARRVGCLVVSIHDLGLGCLDADLVIDGSITRNARARRGQTLAGPQFAVLDPAPFDERGDRLRGGRLQAAQSNIERDPSAVLVALGGGPRAELANDIAEAIVEANPQVRVRIAGGFAGISRQEAAQISWIGPSGSLHAEMARASVSAAIRPVTDGARRGGGWRPSSRRAASDGVCVRRAWGRAGCHPWTGLSGIGCGRMCRTADGRGHAASHRAFGQAAD